jgi:hypothetical protein
MCRFTLELRQWKLGESSLKNVSSSPSAPESLEKTEKQTQEEAKDLAAELLKLFYKDD